MELISARPHDTLARMDIAEKIFPDLKYGVEEIEARYPPRGLPDGAKVMRAAPSPTGFMHIGNMLPFLADERAAHASGGVFFLRVEDTDAKREVAGAIRIIAAALGRHGIIPDEGVMPDGSEKGAYGPYTQSARREIYHAYIKRMLGDGRAYADFATPEELEDIRKKQEAVGARPGYYGRWAKYRDLDEGEVLRRLEAGEPYVVRFKSFGNPDNKIAIKDVIRGNLAFPENDLDAVIMKADGLPTYHFAHVVDDHLMGTTHVLRGAEWLPSLPLHLQMFRLMGWKAPKYAHSSTIDKLDGGARRKLSKRKDPEANIEFYDKAGYPALAVVEYLMNIANSNFEDWRRANPSASYRDFKFELSKMPSSGALLDLAKLESVAKSAIGRMNSSEVYDAAREWALRHDSELLQMLDADGGDYARKIFAIERDGAKNPRKDIAKWSDVKEEIRYFFENPGAAADDLACKEFLDAFAGSSSNAEWFAKMKELAPACGYDGSAGKGISDFINKFRVAITGRDKSPDLFAVMSVMGRDRIGERIGLASGK